MNQCGSFFLPEGAGSMKKTQTIKSNRTFRFLYRKGRSYANPYLALYAHKNRNGTNSIGITVNKKIGKAVVRNRIKRLIRESYRCHEDSIADGYDLVVVSRFKMAGSDFHKTEKALLDGLRHLGMWKEEAE